MDDAIKTIFLDLMNENSKKSENGLNKVFEVNLEQAPSEMIISWNSMLSQSGLIQVLFQVKSDDIWSNEYKLALWSRDGQAKSYDKQEGRFGVLDVDVFTPAEHIDIQGLRVLVRSEDWNQVHLTGLYVSMKLKKKTQETFIKNRAEEKKKKMIECYNPAPVLVQYPVPEIGKRICSPTSCSMAVGRFGKVISPAEMASSAYDHGYDIYGNWILNTAAVGELGFRSYVNYFEDIYELNEYTARGYAIPVSVRTPKDRGFTGALQNYPSGHLMLVTGFAKHEDTWEVIVNDPADSQASNAIRKYPIDEFTEFWNGIGYIVEPMDEVQGSRELEKFDQINRWIPSALLDLKYATSDNFMNKVLYHGDLLDYSMLRIGTLRKLSAADAILKSKGYSIKIWDAYRPLAVQKELWAELPDERYVANPKAGSKHNRGCAIDVTLVDENGQELEMPTEFDCFTELARSDRQDLSLQVMKNLNALQEALTLSGFEVTPDEWWHFNDSDWETYDIV